MTRKCDHTSVGMLVWDDDRLLLIERRKPPFGFAPPAGHVDDHGSFEAAARAELREEVGLETVVLELMVEGRKDNPCRRPDGTWHYWKIYKIRSSGMPFRSLAETRSMAWFNREELRRLATRTQQYLSGALDDRSWECSPGLEPVWYEWLKELHLI